VPVKWDSQKLADALTSCSERGSEYNGETKATIWFNRLKFLCQMQDEPIYFNQETSEQA